MICPQTKAMYSIMMVVAPDSDSGKRQEDLYISVKLNLNHDAG
jgi:hypothetical protein